MDDFPQCSSLTKSGKPCRARPIHGTTTCILHRDSHTAAQLGRIGGMQRVLDIKELRRVAETRTRLTAGINSQPKTVEELQALVSKALTDTINGDMPPRVGQVVGLLAMAMNSLLRTGNLKQRLEAWESWRQKAQDSFLSGKKQ